MDVDRKPSEDASSISNSSILQSGPIATDIEKSTPALEQTPNDFGPPPDGGYEAWMAVLGGFCTVFASFGWINCIGVFQAYYQSNQLAAYSSSTVAWIPSTETFMLFVMGPVAGKLTDDFGPRIPILVGSILHVFGLMMTSISKEYYQIFLAQSVCSAIGCSFLFYPTIAALGTWFLRHRALAFGIAVAGSSIGGIIMPIMVERLIKRDGFGWAMRILAFFLLGLLVIGNLTLKSRLPPSRKKFNIMDFYKPFTEVPFLLLSISGFFLYLGGFLPFNFIITQAIENGMSPDLAGYLVPIVNAASTFGRILPAQLGDMYGVFNVFLILTVLGSLFELAIWLPSSYFPGNALIIVFAALYGFTSGCTFSIFPAMVASMSDVRELGVRNGALYAVSAIGVLVGSPIAGQISLSQDGGFSGLIIFSGVSVMIAAGFCLLSRWKLVGWKVMVKV